MSKLKLLKFPTDYPIKVVGRAEDVLREITDAIVLKYAPDLDMKRTKERKSANGNFVSISYVIRATSPAQVTALANELTACNLVLLVI